MYLLFVTYLGATYKVSFDNPDQMTFVADSLFLDGLFEDIRFGYEN